MQCPNCRAQTNGKFCEYCGSEMPRIAPETVNNDNSNTTNTNNTTNTTSTTIINNYYRSENKQPINIQPVNVKTISDKSKTVALVLVILFGFFGAHQFYAGKTKMGFIYLFTMGLFGFGWIIDIFKVAIGGFKDSYGLPIKQG